jgi:hypothetical protein
MTHKWTSYRGFTEQFEYCELCDQRKGQHDYNCSITIASTPQRQQSNVIHVFYSIDSLLNSDAIQSSCSGSSDLTSWTYYHTFSDEDDITKLEFDNGDILSPKEINAHHNTGTANYFIDKEFRFVRIRESWRHRKGLTADEYYDDSAPISTPVGIVHSRTGPNNQNAGNSPGSQHGQSSGAGLGRIPHTLALRTAMDDAFEELARRYFGDTVSPDNDSED